MNLVKFPENETAGHAVPEYRTAVVEQLVRDGRLEAAEIAYLARLAEVPDDTHALLNYAAILIEFIRFGEAETILRRVIELDPQRWRAWSNLGIVMLWTRRYDDAVAAFLNALRINPSHVPALSSLGIALQESRLAVEALTFFDMALSFEPQNAEVHHNRAVASLTAGDLSRGFAEYEWRLHEQGQPVHELDAPYWKGENFEGRVLLIRQEGGMGDVLQFARYLPLVKARGGRIVLQVPAPLVAILSRMPGVDMVLPMDAALPAFDLVCLIMSLAFLFRTTLETIPFPGGYLAPDPAIVAEWSGRLAVDAARLGRTAPMRVGLVWAGGKRIWSRENYIIDGRRSISFSTLAPLAEAAPAVVFYSLQIGEAAAEADLPPPGMCLVDHTSEIRSFDDTAALISLLDLVIAVDTSTAHLAGALGCPVWMLSRYDQCWRWLIGRDDTPWYDTMRLYVQPAPFDWASPVAQMAADLARLAQASWNLAADVGSA